MKPASDPAMDERSMAATCGPLLPLGLRLACGHLGGQGACGQAAARDGGGRRCAPTALRCSAPGPRRETPFVRCAHCGQTVATSQSTKRAARAGPEPCAARRRPHAPRPARMHLCSCSGGVRRDPHHRRWHSRQAAPGGGSLWSGEEHSPGVGARSALRPLTRRDCLTAVSAANAGSFATRPQGEHRSAVVAKRRPLQREQPPGAACRDAKKAAVSDRQRSAATGRKPPVGGRAFMRRGSRPARWSN